MFDPNDDPLGNSLQARAKDARWKRLREITSGWSQFPGSAPGGSGLTGLASSDAQGYSDMLARQREGLDIKNELAGKEPLDYRQGGPVGTIAPREPSEAEVAFQSAEGPYGTFGMHDTGPYGPATALTALQNMKKVKANAR